MTEMTALSTTDRPDANRIALRALRSLLDAAAPFELTVEGTPIDVQVERLPAAPWPARGLEGLDEALDGPLPRAVRLRCTWSGGSTELLLRASWWKTKSAYRHLVGLQCSVASSDQELGWTSIALQLRKSRDGESVPVPMSFSPFKRRDEDADEVLERQSYPLKAAVERSGLPLVSAWRAEICALRVPSGEVIPSAEEAFRRAVHISLLKLPFFVRGGQEGYLGAPPFTVSPAPRRSPGEIEESTQGHGGDTVRPRRAGIWGLPGGVRQYKQTLDELLDELRERSLTQDELFALLRDRYEVTGTTARAGYANLLLNLGLVRFRAGAYSLTSEGEAYILDPKPRALFEHLHGAYTGMIELLVIASRLGRVDTERADDLLPALLGVTWKTSNQTSFRRNWLLSLGATERRDDGDGLTDLGREIVRDHDTEAAPIRARLDELIADRGLGPPGEDDVDDDDVPDPELESGLSAGADGGANVTPSIAIPSAWNADRLDLRGDQAVAQTAGMELPPLLLEQACAALSAGKHLLFIGPPGTGKTELALALAQTARNDGYCAGAFVATASADWTTFDTIGGYALQRDSSLAFRPGVFLKALERHQWLVLDELNRADVDRAFGELMTVLAGRGTDTPLVREDGELISIGPEAGRTHRIPRTFRVIATMNTWDKTSLFRLSYAVQRRFAMIHVGIPEDDAYARLIDAHATQKGLDPALPDGALGPLQRLFRSDGLFEHRPIGPAVVLDMVRYMRRRQASGDGLAEAIAMYLLPQLEGLEQEPASRALDVLLGSLTGWASSTATSTLRRRYQELFPHLIFSQS